MTQKLFLSDEEIGEILGIEDVKSSLAALERAGFPARDPLVGNRRYWPACKRYFDAAYGITKSSASQPQSDGAERWDD
ncbi:MAG: winged helix-turn-helix domain-containing protein [Pseudomonadota bacterium]